MPNHLHAIVIIENSQHVPTPTRPHVETHGRASLPTPPRPPVQTHGRASLPLERKPKSISSFIAGFKSATNTAIDNAIDNGVHFYPHLGKFNRNNHFWQPNYHDHIIRDAESYKKISDYIANNPANWTTDKYH